MIQITNHARRPLLMVEARPFLDEDSVGARSGVAMTALRKIPEIYEDHGAWGRSHEADEWLSQPDVPAAMVRIIKEDLVALVSSGIFDADVAEPGRRAGVLGRFRRAHSESDES